MHFGNVAILAMATVLGPLASAQLSKPALRQNLEAFGPGLQNALHAPSWRAEQWAPGRIPQKCKAMTERNGHDSSKIKTFNIWYEDCPSQPWLLCRHVDSPLPILQAMDRFGRLPVRMRQWVHQILWLPGGNVPSANAPFGEITIFGLANTVGIYLHETTHAMDFSQAWNYSGGELASSSIWQAAYDADSAVPDEYSRNNQVENLAGFPGLAIYDKLVPGGLRSVEPNIGRIANQLATIVDQAARGKWGGDLLNPTGACGNRFPNSEPVPGGVS